MIPTRARSLFASFRSVIFRNVSNTTQLPKEGKPFLQPKPSTPFITSSLRTPNPLDDLAQQIEKARKFKDPQRIQRADERFRTYPGLIEPDLYVLLMKMWQSVRNEKKMLSVLEDAITKKVALTEELFLPLFELYGDAGNLEKVNSLLLRMKELDVTPHSLTMSTLSSMYAQMGDFDTSDKILQEMTKNKVAILSQAYQGRFAYYCRKYKEEGSVNACKTTIQTMTNSNLEISESQWILIMKTFGYNRLDDQVLATYESLSDDLKRNYQLFNFAIIAHGSKKNFEKVHDLVKDLKRPIHPMVARVALTNLRGAIYKDTINELYDFAIIGKDLTEVFFISALQYLPNKKVVDIYDYFVSKNLFMSKSFLAIYVNQLRGLGEDAGIFRILKYHLDSPTGKLSITAGPVYTMLRDSKEVRLWLRNKDLIKKLRALLATKHNTAPLTPEIEGKLSRFFQDVEKADNVLDEFQKKLSTPE